MQAARLILVDILITNWDSNRKETSSLCLFLPLWKIGTKLNQV